MWGKPVTETELFRAWYTRPGARWRPSRPSPDFFLIAFGSAGNGSLHHWALLERSTRRLLRE